MRNGRRRAIAATHYPLGCLALAFFTNSFVYSLQIDLGISHLRIDARQCPQAVAGP
jgi:hypothetical protein